MNQLNEEHAANNTECFIKWIDKGLMSIYQPDNIAITKSLKDKIQESYHLHISVVASKSFQAGQKIEISHEILLTLQSTSHSAWVESTPGINSWNILLSIWII